MSKVKNLALIWTIIIGLWIGIVLVTYKGVLVYSCVNNNIMACAMLGAE